MILIFNTILAEKARTYFTQTIAPRITLGRPYQVVHLEEDIPLRSKFTHLILSGSELSAAKGSAWDDKIIAVIRSFLQDNKPLLGICHGHQILARTIAGDQTCRRAVQPEFGWKKMELKQNPLFTGISEPVFLESRYDEVCDLPAEFEVIASNKSATVQAFQYERKPVWGVQFHPEMLLQDGTEMVERHLRENPQDRKYWVNELQNPEQVVQSLNIFRNFYLSQ
jgi:GMP synthase (glutamine-hydrolysing)